MLKKNYIKKILLLLIPVLFLAAFKPKEKIHTVLLKTKYGTMRILLYNETPKHRDNFLKLTNEHFYDSLLFHRVIKDFMIQGGDPDSKHAKAGQMLGNGDVGYYVDAEFRPNLFHKKGVIAAARDENPTKASSGCQFYIVQGKNLPMPISINSNSKREEKFQQINAKSIKPLEALPISIRDTQCMEKLLKG